MRHRIAGKQLSRNTSHRRALRRNLAASLFEHGAIRTTLVKAKELRPFVERLITVARKGTLQARRQVISLLRDRDMADKDALKDGRDEVLDVSVVQKLFNEVAPRYADRPGGYTRIIRLAERRIGDAGRQVLLQLVEKTTATETGQVGATASARRKRAARRAEAARSAQTAKSAEADKPEPAAAAQQPDQLAQGEAPAQPAPAQEAAQQPADQPQASPHAEGAAPANNAQADQAKK